MTSKKFTDKIPKQKRCKTCGDKFTPARPLQSVCTPKCGYEHAKRLNDKKAKKDKAELKESLKTHSDYVQETQKVFNEYIRLRDSKLGCVSCGTFTGKRNACHYRSAGGHPELRFNELNVWGGCEYCNTYLHGNLIEYRKELIKRIGVEQVEWIEGKHEPKKYTILELIELKVKYKDKIKSLKSTT